MAALTCRFRLVQGQWLPMIECTQIQEALQLGLLCGFPGTIASPPRHFLAASFVLHLPSSSANILNLTRIPVSMYEYTTLYEVLAPQLQLFGQLNINHGYSDDRTDPSSHEGSEQGQRTSMGVGRSPPA